MAAKTQLAVGVDPGSSRTRCIICALDGNHIRYLSHGLAHAAGWAKGRVIDQDALAESIRGRCESNVSPEERRELRDEAARLREHLAARRKRRLN